MQLLRNLIVVLLRKVLFCLTCLGLISTCAILFDALTTLNDYRNGDSARSADQVIDDIFSAVVLSLICTGATGITLAFLLSIPFSASDAITESPDQSTQ